jgi:hypothetical protein
MRGARRYADGMRKPIIVAALLVTLAAVTPAQAYGPVHLYADPIYLYGTVPSTVVLGTTVPLRYETNASHGSPMSATIYRVPLELAAALVGEDRPVEPTSARGLDIVTTLSAMPSKEPNQSAERAAILPILTPGFYLVVATVAGQAIASLFDVTSLAIVQNAIAKDRVYYAVDMRTFDRHAGPTSLEFRVGSSTRTLAFGADGLLRDERMLQNQTGIFVARTADGSVAIERFDSNNQGRHSLVFVQTDRPVYRPGQTIALRAVVRDGVIGAYIVPKGTKQIKVTAPDGSIVYDHPAALDAFGVAHATIALPADAAVGTYQLSVGDSYDTVAVAAYKKPEYAITLTPHQRFVIGGDTASFGLQAKYFFGRPAAGMSVHYIVTSEPSFVPFFSPYRFVEMYRLPYRPPEKLFEGGATTAPDGTVSINVPTKRTDTLRELTVEFDASDASGRTVSLRDQLDVTPASFALALVPQDWFAQVGRADAVVVSAKGYDGKVRSNVPVAVTIVGSRWNARAGRMDEVSRETRSVTTDGNGATTIDWTPATGGSYTFTATANDERGYVVTGSTYLWVLDATSSPWFVPVSQPQIVVQKEHYAPGERARVLVTLPHADRDALLFVSTDRIISVRVVHFAAQTTALDIAPPPGAPSFNVTIQLPTAQGVSTAFTTVRVDPPPPALRVSIAPSKARYAPGERATFRVIATDMRGKPVRAELGIGVVDESIYAVQAASTGTQLDAFYGDLAYVYPQFSWYIQPSAGLPIASVRAVAANDRYSVQGQAEKALPEAASANATAIRSNFQDTAYWNPSVVTDEHGNATISFAWPDNLTTWRATGLAVTKATQVGEAQADALVTKDFLVRLETPRFLRAGDTSTIIGIAQGQAVHPNVSMRLAAVPLAGFPQTAHLTLDANQSANASWPITAPGVGAVALTLTGSDGTLNDGTQLRLPLLAGTTAEHVRSAGELPSQGSFTVAVPPGYVAGDVHLMLTPSIVAQLVQGLRLLDVYPYYCTEQTMSAALPAVFIGSMLKRAHLPEPADLSTTQVVKKAIARLAQLQHSDGSWGWWEYDDAHPFMTAYAVYGLAEFKQNGFAVDNTMFNRGVDSLVAQLSSANGDTLRLWGGAQPGSEWNTRAFMLFALAQAAPSRVDSTLLAQTHAHAAQLNPYALAVLGLADHQLGDDEAARAVLDELNERATDDGAFTYWKGDTWHYAWEDDPIETTAYALRLEAALDPSSPRIPRIVAFLRAQQRGSWWYTTKDTAAAIYALAQVVRSESEFHPNETVRVLVDGAVVRTLHVTSPVLDAADASIVVSAGSIHDGSVVTFDRSGSGSLYWSADAVRYVPSNVGQTRDIGSGILSMLFASPPNLSVTRSYDAGHPGPWRVGDQVTVHLTVLAHSDIQYVMIEDPYPAGAEHQDDQGHAADALWNGMQLLDDHAAFFADRLVDGQSLNLSYTLRVTTPGTYTAPAPTAGAMYGPPVSLVGRTDHIEVLP